MEQVHGKFAQKTLTNLGTNQVKVGVKMELPTLAKKVLSVLPAVRVHDVTRNGKDCVVSGKVLTRAIFIDEFGGYNSEERSDDFSEKFAVEGENFIPVLGIHPVAEPRFNRADGDLIGSIQGDYIVTVGLSGLKEIEIPYLTDITEKGIEQKCGQKELCTFSDLFFEKFDIGEVITLDANIEGVLGVELNATVKEVANKDGKIVVKGTAVAGVSVVKSVEGGQTIQNNFYDFDFSKTFSKPVTGEIVCANVMICDAQSKVEHREKPELVIEAKLAFTAGAVNWHTVKTVDDAFSCTHDIIFGTANAVSTAVTAQTSMTADVEGNLTMPNGSPFIGKVLWANAGTISGINAKSGDDRATIEGVLNINMVYECEEKGVYSHVCEVPFSVNVKIDGLTPKHSVGASVYPLSCNIKARRGKELIIDARVGVNAGGNLNNAEKLISGAECGAEKPAETASIIIHVVQPNETAWDIAKGLSMPVNKIKGECVAGERIAIYKQRA